jgi:hypothetical protein
LYETSQAYEEKKPKMKKQKKAHGQKECKLGNSQEGRPYIFHLGGDTLKLQTSPCEQP